MGNTADEYPIHPQILGCVERVLGRSTDEIDIKSSFLANGGDSLKAIQLRSALVAAGYDVTRERLLTAPCLGALLSGLFLSAPASPDHSTSSSSFGTQSNSPNEDYIPSPSSPASLSSNEVGRDGFRRLPDGIMALPKPLGFATSTGPLVAPTNTLPPELCEAADLLTEMQLSLIHETYSHCRTNLIEYSEHHPSERVPALFAAWKTVMGSEAIFQGSWLRDVVSSRAQDSSWQTAGPQPWSKSSTPQDTSEWMGVSLNIAHCDADQGGNLVSKITWKIHHAYIDACSLQIFLQKVRDFANGGRAEPGPSFWDWARQLQQYQAAKKSEGDVFWRSILEQHGDAKGEFLLPAPTPPSKVAEHGVSGNAVVETVSFDVEADAVEAAAKSANITPAAVFYAAWALVVATFTDSDSAVFGAVLSGRSLPIPGSIETVGPLINVLPLHFVLSRRASVREFVTALFRNLIELETYSWTTTDNGFTRQYDSALSVEMSEPVGLQQHPFSPLKTHTTQRSQVPISITVKHLRMVELQFHSDRFGTRDMASVTERYKEALSILMKPHTTVGDAMKSLLSCPSHALLMRWGNCISGLTTRPSITEDLVTLFETAVHANPDAMAVEKGSCMLSYRELDFISGQVAAQLASIASPGDVVCVHSDRSLNWICAIWGVLKAGCVYCSLDPALPEQLRESMVRSAGSTVFVTCTDEQLCPSTPKACSYAFSVESTSRNGSDPFGRRASPQPWAAAYVCFTSGSTGLPKPVLCSHAGLVAFQSDLIVRLNAKPGVRISQIMSVAFDGSIHEIFSALTYGATLVLPAGADSLAPLSTANSAILTPSVARALDPSDYPNLQWASCIPNHRHP